VDGPSSPNFGLCRARGQGNIWAFLCVLDMWACSPHGGEREDVPALVGEGLQQGTVVDSPSLAQPESRTRKYE
jgi:hypothetical protein